MLGRKGDGDRVSIGEGGREGILYFIVSVFDYNLYEDGLI